MQWLPGRSLDDVEVYRRVYYDPHMVRVVSRSLVGVIGGFQDDGQCPQFPVKGGPEDGGHCEVALVQSACRVCLQLQSCPPNRWGEAHGAGGFCKNKGVAVVWAWQVAWRHWQVGVDARSLFRGGPGRGGGRLESSGSVDAYSLADDLGCRWIHAYIVAVPLVALCEVAVHILEQVRFWLVECGPFDCLPVLDLGAAVFNRVGGGLRCGAAVFGEHRKDNGWVLGVPRSPVESPFTPRRRGPTPLWSCPSLRPLQSVCAATGDVPG